MDQATAPATTPAAASPLDSAGEPALKVRVDSMTPQDLEARRREIVTAAAGVYENLSNEQLQELAYITSSLRRRTAGPPKTARATGVAKVKPTIDDLL